MIVVRDIWSEIQNVLGTCDEATTYSKLNEAVELLRDSGRWDPGEGFMDICTDKCELTLPDDIEVPLAINIGGTPASFRSKWFEFNMSGPGSECCDDSTSFTWADKGNFPTFRTPSCASALVAYPDLDEGNDVSIRVLGYDEHGKWIMTEDCTGTLVDGFLVPVLIGGGIPTTQKVGRILRVIKPLTRGFVKLVALDPCDCGGGVLLGYYRPNDLEPQYRRITLAGNCCNRLCECNVTNSWVRMRYRRKSFVLNSQDDVIFLHNVTAIKMACKAIRKYEADLIEEYQAFLIQAVAALSRKQKSTSGPNQIRIQFDRAVYASHTGANMI